MIRMFVDTHCHLDFAEFENDYNEVLIRAEKVGIARFHTICTTIGSFPKILKLSSTHPHIFCSFGVHPLYVEKGIPSHNQILSLLNNKKIISLGETGLDYYHPNPNKALQKENFLNHIKAAQKSSLPLVIHTRNAEEDTLEILSSQLEVAPFAGVIHCFTGTEWFAQKCLALGFYISFTGIVTFNSAKEIKEIVRNIPLNKILLETDAPYLAPIPYRGKRNEPSFLIEIAKVVADIKNVELQEVARVTTENFYKLFKKSS